MVARTIVFFIALLLSSVSIRSSCSVNQEISDKLHELLVEINAKSELDYNKIDSLIFYFNQYEKQTKRKVVFPQYESDPELFYTLVDRLFNSVSNKEKSIRAIISLRLAIKSIVEWSEHLSQLIYEVAINNTREFLYTYKKIEAEDRNRILYDLYWMNEFGGKDDFLKNMSTLDNEYELMDVIEGLRTEFD